MRKAKYFAVNLFVVFFSIGPLKNINNVTQVGNTVTIYWPEASKSVDEYVVKYRIKGSTDEWEKNKTTEIFIELDSLNHGTKYEFQVYYVRGGEEIAHTEIFTYEVGIGPGKFDMSCLICIGYCLSSNAISEKKHTGVNLKDICTPFKNSL